MNKEICDYCKKPMGNSSHKEGKYPVHLKCVFNFNYRKTIESYNKPFTKKQIKKIKKLLSQEDRE